MRVLQGEGTLRMPIKYAYPSRTAKLPRQYGSAVKNRQSLEQGSETLPGAKRKCDRIPNLRWNKNHQK